ncbi:hypothetical protein CH367_10960 [Leptospira barantonii]|uniref:Uncharacterized protein n=1 Tax=Leptospira barantonii TaxID=2023184 RepID=A0ABX4NQI5_9LEPT|nr:hypothetical protein CH367_10960 [Leptospira barantonii]
MRSHITVLIHSSTKDIYTSLKQALEPHRLNEDKIESIRSHHWDYWIFPDEPALFDKELEASYPNASSEILENSSYVRNLPEDYSTSGIIRLDGAWIDLQDFGWKMLKKPSSDNDKAWKKWVRHFGQILDENSDQICVQVNIHC